MYLESEHGEASIVFSSVCLSVCMCVCLGAKAENYWSYFDVIFYRVMHFS